MGLTIHYKLRHPGALTAAQAEALVRTAHRRATALVRRRALTGISPVQPADLDNPWHHQFVLETRGNETRAHEVRPKPGWVFTIDLGPGCESAVFGLGFYPETIRAGRRTLSTGFGGWRYSGFCKTEYASRLGWENFRRCHLGVIDLALIWQKLGCEITIKDEGNYWPTRDKTKLRASILEMDQFVAALGGALKDASDEGGPSVESPIFAHGQFELLEAQGLSRHAAKVAQAAKLVQKVSRETES